jgi:hypothetical protein
MRANGPASTVGPFAHPVASGGIHSARSRPIGRINAG